MQVENPAVTELFETDSRQRQNIRKADYDLPDPVGAQSWLWKIHDLMVPIGRHLAVTYRF